MELVFGKNKTLFTSLGIDILAFAIIALAPALSHLSGIPLYYAEPFRIALFILLIYTPKKNALATVALLPLFSFFISAHPPLIKATLISFELLINAFIFYLLTNKKANVFLSAALSIVASKIIYYGLKLVVFEIFLNQGFSIGISLYVQAVVILITSFGVGILFNKKENKNI